MNLWRKLTLDWPCALGNWLWLILVVKPAALIDRLTFRRILQLAGVILFFMFFQLLVSAHLGFLFGMDVSALLDFIGVVLLVNIGGRARQALLVTAQTVRRAFSNRLNFLYRLGTRQRRN